MCGVGIPFISKMLYIDAGHIYSESFRYYSKTIQTRVFLYDSQGLVKYLRLGIYKLDFTLDTLHFTNLSYIFKVFSNSTHFLLKYCPI